MVGLSQWNQGRRRLAEAQGLRQQAEGLRDKETLSQAREQYAKGDRNAALETIRSILDSNYVGPEARLLQAGILVDNRRSEEAVQILNRLPAEPREIAGAAHALLARILRISGLLPGGMLPVAPSAIKPSGQAVTPEGMKPFETPHALALSGIPGIIEQFRSGARNALDAGFDGVEIHGANGYLPDQFLRDGSNQRSDAYGGSIANRARLMLEVVDAVCGVWGANRVGIRLSPLQPFNDMRDSNPIDPSRRHLKSPFLSFKSPFSHP